MNETFADTFYWLARLNVEDAAHRKAVELFETIRRKKVKLVTSKAVLIEVMDALCQPASRALAHQFWRAVHNDDSVIVVGLDDDLLEVAASMFRTRADKAWSITDCTSFAIMERRGISEALTGDRHFQQAGFRTLF